MNAFTPPLVIDTPIENIDYNPIRKKTTEDGEIENEAEDNNWQIS